MRASTESVAFGGAALVLAVVTAMVLVEPTARHDPKPPAVAAILPAATPRPTSTPDPSAPPTPSSAPWQQPVSGPGYLQPGSNPAVLPAALLIADKLNNRLIVVDQQGRVRWEFPRPGDLAPGQTFAVPDDAFFSRDGRSIVATQEDDSVISVIDVATHRITYRYGVPGHPGSGANHLSNPDDAMMLTGGYLLSADIKNCRIVIIAPGGRVPRRVIGDTTSACQHAPPVHWGSPNGVFPMRDGRYLVTEINGDWVDAIGLNGKVYWSIHPPGVNYPSDSNQIAVDRYLTVDYSSPGQIVIFDRAGHTIWRYQGSGRNVLDHPSLALPLPNGDIALNDDYNDRVIVVDPRTDKIVWQYGRTHVRGSRSGLLDNPDGIDLVPPMSFLMTSPNPLLPRW